MHFVCVFEAVYVCVCAGQSKTGSIVKAFETLLTYNAVNDPRDVSSVAIFHVRSTRNVNMPPLHPTPQSRYSKTCVLRERFSVRRHIHIYIYIYIYIYTYVHIIHMYINTFTHVFLHTCIHTYIQAGRHACIHTYIHTYTYIFF